MLGFLCIPTSAQAQSVGETTLGVSGGYASYNEGGFANIYLQSVVAPHVRLAPELGYVFRNEGKSAFTATVDLHFPFRLAPKIGIYPLTGVTLNNWHYSHGGDATRVGVDFGAGFDFNLARNLKLTMQGKYSLMNDTGGAFLNFGIGYVL